jgi:hypothetical protein
MDKDRKYLKLVCEICEKEYLQQERVHEIARWKNRCSKHRGKYHEPNYKKKIRIIPNHKKKKRVRKMGTCMDCEKVVKSTSKRCKKCYGKSISFPKKNCAICNGYVSKQAIICIKCHNIRQDRGLSKARVKFQNSKEWNKLRRECFNRDDYTCKICGNTGGYLEAHHIKDYANHKELRLSIDNLITYCIECHREYHKTHVVRKFKNASN